MRAFMTRNPLTPASIARDRLVRVIAEDRRGEGRWERVPGGLVCPLFIGLATSMFLMMPRERRELMRLFKTRCRWVAR